MTVRCPEKTDVDTTQFTDKTGRQLLRQNRYRQQANVEISKCRQTDTPTKTKMRQADVWASQTAKDMQT